MTLVVADTGPIRYLIIIEAIDLLARVYERVVLPTAVLAELSNFKAPATVRHWASNLPGWIEVKSPAHMSSVRGLNAGEADAIALAIELKATAILLDEAEGRKVALQRGLPVAGTIGFLELAAQKNLVDLKTALAKLAQTNFRIDPALIRDALERAKARIPKE
jgi:predicted nucleic acid-binding protein